MRNSWERCESCLSWVCRGAPPGYGLCAAQSVGLGGPPKCRLTDADSWCSLWDGKIPDYSGGPNGLNAPHE